MRKKAYSSAKVGVVSTFDQLRNTLLGGDKDPSLATNVFVVGLGRFGVSLAQALVEMGIEVMAIDTDQKLVNKWSDRLTHVRIADGTSADTLRQLGAIEFDAAVVAIGTGVEASILTTAALIDLGAKNVWAKAITAEHARILTRVGAHNVVQPEYEMGKRVARQVSGEVVDYISIDDGFVLAEIEVPKMYDQVQVSQTAVSEDFDVTIVSLKRAGRSFSHAAPSTVLTAGDVAFIAGRVDDVERFAKHIA